MSLSPDLERLLFDNEYAVLQAIYHCQDRGFPTTHLNILNHCDLKENITEQIIEFLDGFGLIKYLANQEAVVTDYGFTKMGEYNQNKFSYYDKKNLELHRIVLQQAERIAELEAGHALVALDKKNKELENEKRNVQTRTKSTSKDLVSDPHG